MPLEDTQQMTHRQHAVPQNIMDVEFKIIGDLTMRQFFYLMIFGGLAYVIFTQVGSFVKYPIVLGLVAIGVALAFIPFEERTMDEWIVNFFRAIFQENQAIWRKSPEAISAFAYEDLNIMKQELITLTPTSSRRKLEEYLDAQTRKKPHDPLDIQDSVFIKKVRDAFYKEPTTVTQTTVLPKPQERPPYVQVLPQQPQHEPLPSRGPKIEGKEEEKAEIEKREEAGRPTEPAAEQIPAEVEAGAPPSVPPAPATPLPPQPQPQPEQPAEIVKRDTSGMSGIQLPPREYQPLETITPDKHTGRIFTSLLPKEGEIVLPIKRERILKSSEEKEIEKDIKEKADQLKALISSMSTEKGLGTPTQKPAPPAEQEKPPEKPPEPKEKKKEKPKEEKKEEKPFEPMIIKEKIVGKESTKTLEKLKGQIAKIKKEIDELKKDIAHAKDEREKTEKKAKLQGLEKEREEKEQSYTGIGGNLKDLTDVFSREDVIEPDEIPTDKAPEKPPEPSKINIVSGSVQEDNSGKSLEGIVLIIKSEKGEPVRAIKTNKIGRFVISTPLTNGKYTIETDKSKKTDLSFDIINIEAKGGEIPEVIIKGKR